MLACFQVHSSVLCLPSVGEFPGTLLCCGLFPNTGLGYQLCPSHCRRVSKDITISLQSSRGLLAMTANYAFPLVGVPFAAFLRTVQPVHTPHFDVPCSSGPSHRSTMSGQGNSLDFGFVVQCSHDRPRPCGLSRLHGASDYYLIIDILTSHRLGKCFSSKAPPIGFLNC